MIYICSLSDSCESTGGDKINLKTIEEVYRVISDKKTRQIIMKDDFIERYFTPVGLASFIKECKIINNLLSIDYDTNQEMHDLNGQCEVVHRAAQADNSRLINMQLEMTETKYLLDREIKEHFRTSQELAKTTAELNKLVQHMKASFNRTGMNENCNSIKNGNRYNKVLYIKEITRVRYVDTLLLHLQEIMRSAASKQVRIMVVEPSFTDSRIVLYPEFKPYDGIMIRNALSHNIFIAGVQARLIEDVLDNPTNAECLIVLDRSGSENLYITGSNMEVLYTVSDLEDIKFNVLQKRVISYSSQTLHIPYIEGFQELTPENQIQKYSSLDVTKTILALL